MSQETAHWLFTKVLIGNVLKRGTKAWHWRAAREGERSNHYDGPVPVADVRERLFNQVRAEAVPMFVPALGGGDDAAMVEAKGWQVVRNAVDGHIFRPFTNGHGIHQYDEWLLENVETILDEGLEVESAGLLRHDGLAWVQVALPETHQAAGGVSHRPYLTAATSHDGSLKSTYFTGTTFVQCDNTLEMALGSATNRIGIKHTRKSVERTELRIADVREALSIVFQATEAIDKEIDRMLGIKVSDAELAKFLDEYDPIAEAEGVARRKAQERHAQYQLMWKSDDRVAPWAGTAFGVLQLTNTYRTQVRPVRNVQRADRVMQDVILGQGNKDDAAAMKLLAGVLG